MAPRWKMRPEGFYNVPLFANAAALAAVATVTHAKDCIVLLSLDQICLKFALLWNPVLVFSPGERIYRFVLCGAALLALLSFAGWRVPRLTTVVSRICGILGLVAGAGILAMASQSTLKAFENPYGLSRKEQVAIDEFPQKKLIELFGPEMNIRELDFASNLALRPWLLGEAVHVYKSKGQRHKGFSTPRLFNYAAVTSVTELPLDAWSALEELIEIENFNALNGYSVTVYSTRSGGRHLQLFGNSVSLAVEAASSD